MAKRLMIGGKAVFFNPAEYTITTTAVYNESTPRTEITAVNKKSLEMELFYDATLETGKDVSREMDALLPSGDAVEIKWNGSLLGSGDVNKWRLNGFEKYITKFSEEGTPLRGFLHLAFKHDQLAEGQVPGPGKKTTGTVRVDLSWKDDGGNHVMTAVYSPASYRIYSAGMAEESDTAVHELSAGKRFLDFSLLLDAGRYENAADLKGEINGLTRLIKPLEEGKKKAEVKLPEVKIDFGASKPLKSVSTLTTGGRWFLVRLVEQYTKFGEDGVPVRANLDLEFVET